MYANCQLYLIVIFSLLCCASVFGQKQKVWLDADPGNENPCGQNPCESEMLIQASDKYGKLIQVDSQRRSFSTLIEAVKEVRGGVIGNPCFAKAWYTNSRKSIGVGKKVLYPSRWILISGRARHHDRLIRTI